MMKRAKKFLALFCAVVLVVNILPHYAMAQNTQSTSAENENLISDGSFEGFVPDTLTSNQITSYESDYVSGRSPSRQYNYNGAEPTSGWEGYITSGAAVLQPVLGDAADGNVSMKFTPSSTGGRMSLRYDVPTAVYNEMVEGASYKVTAYFKTEGTISGFNPRIEVHNGTNDKHKSFTAGDTWTKVEHTFVLEKATRKNQLYFMFGMSGSGTSGAMYIDNISLELVALPSITLNETQEELEKNETLQLTSTLTPTADTSKIPDAVVQFKSSDENVATVDGNGLITAIGVGTATITAYAYHETVTADCTVTVKEESQEPGGETTENKNLISDGSFEGFVSDTLIQDQITKLPSDYVSGRSPSRQYNYNGATPTAGWQPYVDSGTGYFQPHLVGAQDGKVAIKLSTGDVSGKMNLRYDVPAAVYETLADGNEYKLTLYVKGENIDKVRIQIINGNNKNTTESLNPGQWTKIERTFKIDKSVSNKNYLRFFFGMESETTNTALYIDNISLVKAETASFQLETTQKELNVGDTFQLKPILTSANAGAVTFVSSNSNVATVDATGNVTAVGKGTAIITATLVTSGAPATCAVTVKEPEQEPEADHFVIKDGSFESIIDSSIKQSDITSLESTLTTVDGKTVRNPQNNGARMEKEWEIYIVSGSAVFRPYVNDAHDGSKSVKISTGDTAGRLVLRYNVSSEVRKAIQVGDQYKITAWYKGTTDTKARVEVKYNGVTTKTVGTLSATQWTKVEQVITINNPVTELIFFFGMDSEGENRELYLDNITVEKLTPAEITLGETEKALLLGESFQLTPNLTSANAGQVTFTSSNTHVVTVDSTGKVTAVGRGTATITAMVAGSGATATCTVTVTDPSLDDPNAIIKDGSFEGFISAGFTANQIGKELSDYVAGREPARIPRYNGMTPTNGWEAYINSGSVLLQPSLTGTYDGDVCLKITPSKDGGRLMMRYNIPKDVCQEKLEVGAVYKLTAYFRSPDVEEGGTRIESARIEIKDIADLAKSFAVHSEWTKVELEFVVTNNDTSARIFMGMSSAAVEGELYVDNVSLERVYAATGITLNTQNTTLAIGEKLQLRPTLMPSDAKSDVIYTSSNEDVVTVDKNGKLTAVGEGTAVIKAMALEGGVTARCTVRVVREHIPLKSIAMNKTSLSVNPGWQEKLMAVLTPANTTDDQILWTSSNEAVVSVDQSGNILARKAGTATITAAVGSKRTTCVVTVKEDANFKSTSCDLSVDFGRANVVDLSKLLKGKYTVISAPNKGKVELSGNVLTYTAYTWLMEDGKYGFADMVYRDEVLIAVMDGQRSAIITLKVTINKLEDLFYDDSGNWITDVELLFSKELLETIKAEAAADPEGLRAQLIRRVLEKADSYNEIIPWEYEAPGTAEDGSETGTGDATMQYLMAYLLTKDVKGYEKLNSDYLLKTIHWLRASLSYPYWGTTNPSSRNADRAAGHQLFSVSMAYYWLREELVPFTCKDVMGTDGTMGTVVTRRDVPILEAMEKRLWFVGEELYNNSMQYDVYVMNHCHIRYAGLLTAAMALRADAQTAAQKQALVNWTGIALYKNGLGMNSLMPDGSSQEGPEYWAYGAEWLLKMNLIAEQALGIDLLETTQWLANSTDYALSTLVPRNFLRTPTQIINMGDSYATPPRGITSVLRLIAAEYQDEVAQWLAQMLEDAGRDPQNSSIWMSALFTDTSLNMTSPAKAGKLTLKHFEDIDMVVSRTDWSGREDLLIMKTGVPSGKNLRELVRLGLYTGNPDAGHAHPDANHITLYSNGEFLLRDEGYAEPKNTSNHNTLLVNGEGQLGGSGQWMEEAPYIESEDIPYMKVVESNDTYGYDYIVGDATAAYGPAINRFERNIVFLKEAKVLLVVDNISASQKADLELHWFPGSDRVAKIGDTYRMLGERNNMTFYTFTKGVNTSFDTLVVTHRATTAQEKAFVQKTYASQWQNAVAFCWNENTGELAKVKYMVGTNANEHQFEIDGKIYTINVASNTVTVDDGTLNTAEDTSAGDSTVSAVMINGLVLSLADVTGTLEVDRWWKTREMDVQVFPNAEGAKFTVEYDKTDPKEIKITCISPDQSNTSSYTIKVTNSQRILGIAGISASVVAPGYNLAHIYDGKISTTTKEPDIFWVGQNLPEIVFDMGDVVCVEEIDIAFHLSYERDSYFDIMVSLDGENWTSLVEDGVAKRTPGTSIPDHSEYVTVTTGQSAIARYVMVRHRGQSSSGKDNPAAFNGMQEITIKGYRTAGVSGGKIVECVDMGNGVYQLTVTAEVPGGKRFVRWETEGFTLEDATLETVTFTFNSGDSIKLTAIFEDVYVPPADDLAPPPAGDGTVPPGKDPADPIVGTLVVVISALIAVSALTTVFVLLKKKKHTAK